MLYLIIASLLLAGCSLSIGGRYTTEAIRTPVAPVVLAVGKRCTMLIHDEPVTVEIVGLKDGEDPCKSFR